MMKAWRVAVGLGALMLAPSAMARLICMASARQSNRRGRASGASLNGSIVWRSAASRSAPGVASRAVSDGGA